MMMRAALVLVLLVVTCVAVEARAAEPAGNLEQDALAAMGLGGMEVMSDKEGEKVRGEFAFAFGAGRSNFNSFFGNSTQFTTFGAADFGPGPDLAVGANVGAAGGGVLIPGRGAGVGGTFNFGGAFAFSGR